MSYAFRGLDREEALRAFSGPRVDPVSDRVVKAVDKGRTTILPIPREQTKLGLTITSSSDALIWCEGSLGDFLGADEGLRSSSLVEAGEDAARCLARRLGVVLDTCTATVRRCDLASDVRFVNSGDGYAFLRAAKSLVLPLHKTRVITARGSHAVETVAWENSSGIQLRIYDKSSQRGERGGSLVRIERQWRPPAREQIAPARVAVRDLSDIFGKPLRRWTVDGLVVVAPADAYWILKDRIGSALPGNRTLTPRIAERMHGTLFKLLAEGDAAFANKRQARERRAELRAVGIEVDDQVSTVIDIGNVLLAAMRPWEPQERTP